MQQLSISEEEKNQYVEEMIELLELQDLSEALVFSLNVEAQKRLMISIELVSKLELLLFLHLVWTCKGIQTTFILNGQWC